MRCQTAARRGWPIRARLGLLGRHPWLMFGFGLAVWGCLFVPLLNLAFMPLSVAGGTLLFLDLEGRSRPPATPRSAADEAAM